jgi:hypothetical protein
LRVASFDAFFAQLNLKGKRWILWILDVNERRRGLDGDVAVPSSESSIHCEKHSCGRETEGWKIEHVTMSSNIAKGLKTGNNIMLRNHSRKACFGGKEGKFFPGSPT